MRRVDRLWVLCTVFVLILSACGVGGPTPSSAPAADATAASSEETTAAVPAAITTVLLVLAVNFVGDGIRDALDPQAIER